MTTTIQISKELQEELTKRKLYEKETYEEVLWDALEDTMELSEETKKEIMESREEIKKGKFKSLEQIEKEMR